MTCALGFHVGMMLCATLFLLLAVSVSDAMTHHHNQRYSRSPSLLCNSRSDTEWCDPMNRGIEHLSAFLEEGDIVLYRSGSWFVDNVEVGDKPPALQLGRVAVIQLVWTHDCEHGYIYVDPLKRAVRLAGSSNIVADNTCLLMDNEGDGEEGPGLQLFGPEQLLAILGVVSLQTKYHDFTDSHSASADIKTTTKGYQLVDSFTSLEDTTGLKFLS